MPLGGSRGIEHHGQVRRCLALDQVEQGGGEAESRTGIESLAIHTGRTDEAEVGAVDEGVGVEEEKATVFGGRSGHGGKVASRHVGPCIWPWPTQDRGPRLGLAGWVVQGFKDRLCIGAEKNVLGG